MTRIFSTALTAAFLLVGTLAPGAESLTITTYNIHSGIPSGASNASYQPCSQDLENVADVLTTCGAEIIGLQEVRNNWTLSVPGKARCPIDMALYLANALDMNFAFASTLDSVRGYPENRGYIEWGKPDQWTNNAARHGEYGNAVLSKFEMADKPVLVKLPRGNDEVAKKKGDEPRNAVKVELEDVPGFGRVIVYNTHFQHNNGNTRKAQMAELLRLGKADAGKATVFLMGDFNHFPHKGEPDLMKMAKKAGFHDLAGVYAEKTGTKVAATMQGDHRRERIDYIFCSKRVNVTDVTVLKTDVSDHLPVTVTVTLEQ